MDLAEGRSSEDFTFAEVLALLFLASRADGIPAASRIRTRRCLIAETVTPVNLLIWRSNVTLR